MLVIISGAETVHKKFFAAEILKTLIPAFDIGDGYRVSFSKYPFEIFDPTGKSVYRPFESNEDPGTHELINNPSDGSANEFGIAKLTRANDMFAKLFTDNIRDNHFQNFFIDIPSDYGYGNGTPLWESKPVQFLHPHSYEDVLKNYNDSPFPVHVITGNFSKLFIDMIREEIGAENVVAINILRNPSVSYLLHERGAEVYEEKGLPLTPQTDEIKINRATLNMVNLARFNDITTYRFEDILKNGYFDLNGTRIALPPAHVNYNDIITEYELEHLNRRIVTDEAYNAFIAWCQDPQPDNLADYPDVDNNPKNFFTTLNYPILNFDQIIAKG